MSPTPSITCPACQRRFRWKPKLAGRRVRCRCKAVIDVPAEPTPDEPSPPRADASRCPQCDEPLSEQAVLCVSCGYSLARGAELQTQVASADAPSEAPGRWAWLKPLGRYAGAVVLVAVGVGLLHSFMPYMDQYFGDSVRERRRAAEQLEEYTAMARFVRGALVGGAAGAVIMLITAAERWRRSRR